MTRYTADLSSPTSGQLSDEEFEACADQLADEWARLGPVGAEE